MRIANLAGRAVLLAGDGVGVLTVVQSWVRGDVQRAG